MPITKSEDDDLSIFRVYHCKTPQQSTVQDVPHNTEVQLLEDLHEMWDGGWQIAHVFPNGTSILMIRRPEWIEKVDDKRRERREAKEKTRGKTAKETGK